MRISLKNKVCSKKSYFSPCYYQYCTALPNFMPKCESLPLLFTQLSLLKSDGSDSLSLLFTKEQPWAKRSHCSFQKSNREQVSPIAHDKRETRVIHSFSWANHSFAQKKWFAQKKPMNKFPIPISCQNNPPLERAFCFFSGTIKLKFRRMAQIKKEIKFSIPNAT